MSKTDTASAAHHQLRRGQPVRLRPQQLASAPSTPTAHPSPEAWPALRQTVRRPHPYGIVPAGGGPGPRSVIVLPSRALDRWAEPAAETQAYEERLLAVLLRLQDPRLRLTYVTSGPVPAETIDYYLSFLPARVRMSARDRLTMISVGDRTRRSLAEKLRDRADLLQDMRRTTVRSSSTWLVPYNVTELEREVAEAVGAQLYGADPTNGRLGTKSGSREVFAAAGVPCPLGVQDVYTVADVLAAATRIRAAKPQVAELVLKLDHGVGGEGNAVIDVADLPPPGAPDEEARLAQRLEVLVPEARAIAPAALLARLRVRGGVVEERVVNAQLRSPSVQLQLTPAGAVEILSTHDQILAGPNGHTYLGCRFPADPAYAPEIARRGFQIGLHLAALGVVGQVGVDFLAGRDGNDRWQLLALELNLRMGGTTHTYEAVRGLTGGVYDADSACFTTPAAEPRHYVATDHAEAPAGSGLTAERVLDLAGHPDVGFECARGVGTVFHMISTAANLGRVGFTAIGASAADANARYHDMLGRLARESADTSNAAARGRRAASSQ